MNRSLLLRVAACGCVVAAVGIATGQLPSCSPGASNGPAATLLDRDGPHRLDHEAADSKVLARAWSERKAAADDVIERRVSLAQAVARFRAVDDALPTALRSRGEMFAEGHTPEEKYWRYVIRVTLNQLIGDPRRAEVATRLETELQDFLRSRLGPKADDGAARLADAQRRTGPRVERPLRPVRSGPIKLLRPDGEG